MTLYELTGEMIELQDMLEQMPEDDSIPDTMEIVAYDLGEKVDGYVKVIKNIEAEADALKREETILATKRKYLTNNIERLKKSLFEALNVLDAKEVKGSLFTIKKRKNPAKLPTDLDIKLVPEEYIIQQEPVIDKRELLRAVKAGKVDNIELVQSESLMIK